MNLNQLCTFNYPIYPDDPTKTTLTKIHNKNEDTTLIISSSSTASTISTTIATGTATSQQINTNEDTYLLGESTTKHPINRNVASSSGTTIPTGCQDLKNSGHSLNGLYSVKSNRTKNKIDTVFCIFNSDQGTVEKKKKLVIQIQL